MLRFIVSWEAFTSQKTGQEYPAGRAVYTTEKSAFNAYDRFTKAGAYPVMSTERN